LGFSEDVYFVYNVECNHELLLINERGE